MAEQENKKPIYKKWWFWAIIIVVIIIIGGSGSSNNTTKSTLNTEADKTQENQEVTTNVDIKKYGVGEIYEDKNVAIKFVSLDDNFKGYNKYADIKSGHKIVKGEFEFENLGSTDFLASSYNFNCYADGYDCEAFWSTENSTFSSNLSAGKKAKGSVYFEVPENAAEITIEYETNMFTSNKVIFVVK